MPATTGMLETSTPKATVGPTRDSSSTPGDEGVVSRASGLEPIPERLFGRDAIVFIAGRVICIRISRIDVCFIRDVVFGGVVVISTERGFVVLFRRSACLE